MKLSVKCCVFVFLLGFISGQVNALYSDYEKNIFFLVHNDDNQVFNWTYSTNDFEAASCSTSGPLSFIVPGWKEDCTTTEWVPVMIQNLKKHRGGCIVCMDYSYYANSVDYFALQIRYPMIARVLKKEYLAFQNEGHEPSNVFFFGFSFGAQLALDLGRKINKLHEGSYLIARMDLCEPTGIGFLNVEDSKLSADNVQCIHTNSAGYGRLKRDCHQDWNMGSCGNYQTAAGPYPKGHHGLCPFFYNSAFDNNFYATKKSRLCITRTASKSEWPEGFKMGFLENRFENVTGEFFAATTKNYPYNMEAPQNDIIEGVTDRWNLTSADNEILQTV